MTKNRQLATLTVTKVYLKDNVEVESDEQQETIEVRNFETEPAEVGINYGLTINLGDFNSARVDVSVKIPCYVEEKDEAFANISAWAEDRIRKEVEIINLRKKKTKGSFDM
jgi:hypothetical protein